MRILILTGIMLLAFAFSGLAGDVCEVSNGVKPVDEWNCPKTHPIKGNVNVQKGTRIYHLPGGAFYNKTKPEKCFAAEDDAKKDGFRKSKR